MKGRIFALDAGRGMAINMMGRKQAEIMYLLRIQQQKGKQQWCISAVDL
jgi:hypothetical protein